MSGRSDVVPVQSHKCETRVKPGSKSRLACHARTAWATVCAVLLVCHELMKLLKQSGLPNRLFGLKLRVVPCERQLFSLGSFSFVL